VAARLLEDEMVIMCARTSKLFVLNAVATAIWNALDGVTPLAQIVTEQVCANFDVGFEPALADASELVQELAEHGILITAEQPLPSGAENVALECV
jgi:hypothetical protein